MIVNFFSFLSFFPLVCVHAMWMIRAVALTNVHLAGVIPVLAKLAFSPRCIPGCVECSCSLMEQHMIGVVLTNYKNLIVISTKWMMDSCLWWKRLSEYLLCSEGMFSCVEIFKSSLWGLNKPITVLERSTTFPSVPMTIPQSWTVFTDVAKWFSLYPSFCFLGAMGDLCLLSASALAEAFWYHSPSCS